MWKVSGTVHGIDHEPEPMRSFMATWAYRTRATAAAAVPYRCVVVVSLMGRSSSALRVPGRRPGGLPHQASTSG